MTQEVADLIKEYLPKIIKAGTALGTFIPVIAILLSYAVNKALSLVDDK